MSGAGGATSIALWPPSPGAGRQAPANNAPGAVGDLEIDHPRLTVYLPEAGLATGAGVIVNPGGGYRVLAADHEGVQVARWLNRRGIAAFVLRYRVAERYPSEISLLDGLRAMRLVRCRAGEFGVAENRVGMLGFSAGGHLAVAVGTRWDAGDPGAADPIDRVSSRPDFLVAVYAVTNGVRRGRKAAEYTPADVRVDASTPPTFLVHGHQDGIVPASQSTLFYDALLNAGVAAELHIYGHGGHGMGLGVGDPDFCQWPLLLGNWLRRRGLLTGQPRRAVSGRVTLDGEPMGRAWISLLPVDENAPPASAGTSRSDDGKFAIAAADGIVPGLHRVAVYHLSEQSADTNAGVPTLPDAAGYAGGTVAVGDQPLIIRLRGTDAARRL